MTIIHIQRYCTSFKESLLRNRQQNICIVLLLLLYIVTGEQLVVYQALLYAPF